MTFDFTHSPPVLRQDGFSVCGDNWQIEGFPFIDNDVLWSTYYPDRQGWMGFSRNDSESTRWWFSQGKPFFAAQLRYRGIDCPAWLGTETALQMLKDALDCGVGAGMADSIVETEESMRRLYKPVYEQWKAQTFAIKTKPLTPSFPLTPESIHVKDEVMSLDGYESSNRDVESVADLGEPTRESVEHSEDDLENSDDASVMESENESLDLATQDSEAYSEEELDDDSASLTSGYEELSREDQAWEEALTSADQARVSVKRFLQHYYFTCGEVNPSRTPGPMVLRGFSDILALDEAIIELDIDGLETAFAGDDGANSVCIGWGRDDLRAFASALRRPILRQSRQQTRQGSLMNQLMPVHTKYAAEVARSKRDASTAVEAHGEFAGQYVVRCQKAAEWMVSQKMSSHDAIRLSIYDGSRVGEGHLTYHLGPFADTIQLRAADSANSGSALSTSGTQDEEAEQQQATGRKRKAPSSRGQAGPSTKQARLSESNGPRFVLYGPCLDQSPTQARSEEMLGCLEFEDPECMVFRGSLYIRSMGAEVEIQGYKTGGTS